MLSRIPHSTNVELSTTINRVIYSIADSFASDINQPYVANSECRDRRVELSCEFHAGISLIYFLSFIFLNIILGSISFIHHSSKLLNKDILSKSDPIVYCYLLSNQRQWIELGRTERIDDTLNPEFVKTIQTDYYFEDIQVIKFDVYDIDRINGTLNEQDFLGTYQTTLGKIVASKGKILNAYLTDRNNSSRGNKFGSIKIIANECGDLNTFMKLRMSGKKLDKKDWFGKSDPYFQLHRRNPDESFAVVYRSNIVKKNLNPNWNECQIDLHTLCGGNIDMPLRISVFDYDKGSDEYIGEVDLTLKQLQQSTRLTLFNKRRKKIKAAGELIIHSCNVIKVPSFLEYVSGGMELKLLTSIDFTASNGDPRIPTSLHYMERGRLNHYESAIISVGNILEVYDRDKLFPVYGFGARLSDGSVSHFFPLNGNFASPIVFGIPGIIEVYRHAISSVTLYGPTYFAPTLHAITQHLVTQISIKGKEKVGYTILLILTDGEILDYDETISALVDASKLPLSIVIVGVGEADFGKMEGLDGDGVVLTDIKGRKCTRDIVQFVPFRNCARNGICEGELLAKEVLAEIPTQFREYVMANGIMPGSPIESDGYFHE